MIWDMYADYINGKREIAEIIMDLPEYKRYSTGTGKENEMQLYQGRPADMTGRQDKENGYMNY
ncbi:MAG: hypothetical protein ACLUI7_11840 [Coprococcus sp.]